MTSVFSIFSEADLETEIAAGFVSRKYDLSGWFAVLNYTPAAAYSRRWNPVTLASRGLIYDVATKEIVARPFAKFFNYGEVDSDQIPLHKPAIVTPKMDGSLGILYKTISGGHRIATRGSFLSEQALWASDFWAANYGHVVVPESITPLFEIIYPSNRIVVNYGDKEALVLLATIDNATGADIPLEEAEWWPGEVVEVLADLSDPHAAWEAVISGKFNGEEGVVLCWPQPDGPSLRIKIKDEEYIRLHRIVTGVSTKTIWQALKDGESLNELLDNVPDEFNEWVRAQIGAFTEAFNKKADEVYNNFDDIIHSPAFNGTDPLENKRNFAIQIKDHPDKSYLFARYDGKDISQQIWKELKPAYSTPFAEDEA